MVRYTSAALFLLAASCEASTSVRSQQRSRKLSGQYIAGYETGSVVTDHNAIDLDQAALEIQLALGTTDSFAAARAIYEQGAFSKSVAEVTLDTPLTAALTEGSEVLGKSASGQDIKGTIYDGYPAGSSTIQIQYTTSDIQESYVGCQVGANPDPNTVGCFSTDGTLVVDGLATPLEYTYNPLTQTTNGRTIQGFSTDARSKMYEGCPGCPYQDYLKFYEYYGKFDYADHWVLSAFDGARTSFTRGDANFGLYGPTGRAEVIKKGTAYMNVWMYVVREFEDALDDCQEGCTTLGCNDDPVHAWDEGVAFYTGSLEGTDGAGDGKLVYALADKRCANFRTCGDLADSATGTSHVNIELLRQFQEGKRKLLEGKCSEARNNKNAIVNLMKVPLIQGTLRYAYITDFEDSSEKPEAEGAVFAASILPLVHACDEDAANIIYDDMRVGQAGTANFADVKGAFERVYECLGVSCKQVGGLYDDTTGDYFPGAAPCSSASSVGLSIVAGVTTLGLLVAGLFF